MSNLQSLLLPVSGPLPASNPLKHAAQQPNALAQSGEDSSDELTGSDENEAPNFLQLLDSSTPVDESEPVHVYHGDAEPESIAMRGGQAFELKNFDGNQFPFWGSSLPADSLEITENSTREQGLPTAQLPLESNTIQVLPEHVSAVAAPGSLPPFDVAEEIVDVLHAETETHLTEALDASIELLNVTADDITSDATAAAVIPADGYLFPLPSDNLVKSSALQVNSMSLPRQASTPLGQAEDLSELESAALLQFKNTDVVLVPAASELGSTGDKIVTAAQSMEIFSKFMIDHTRNSRFQNGGIATAFDAPLNYQDTIIDDGGLDSLLGVQSAKLGDNLAAKAFSGMLPPPAGDSQSSVSLAAQATTISAALSQWRAEQDSSSAIGIDSLERQGLLKVAVPFSQAAWGENLGSQLSLLMAKNMDSAQIQLDPPELGPLGVRIQLNNDQVSLQFTSAHAVVRDALEQSSQKLQQMLSEEGLDLVDVDVSDERQQEPRSSDKEQDGSSASALENQNSSDGQMPSDDLLTNPRNLIVDDGKIDYFV